MRDLLRTFSWQDLRRHPWRSIAAIAAVMLGVALALAVHLINASALSEFSAAVRAVNGQPDLELRATQGSFDEALFARVAADEAVTLASPVLELATNAVGRNGKRVSLRVLGLDALAAAAVAPNLVPRAFEGSDRMALFAPGAVFLNGAASERLPVDRVHLQAGLQMLEVRVAGSVAAAGAPLAVMDIGAAQDLFGRAGVLSRIDVQLRAGTDAAAWARPAAARRCATARRRARTGPARRRCPSPPAAPRPLPRCRPRARPASAARLAAAPGRRAGDRWPRR